METTRQFEERWASVAGSRAPARPKPATKLPPGVLCGENQFGRVFFKDEFFPLDYLHGRVRLDSVFGVDEALLARLAAGLTPQHIQEAAYLDIETTGLSGGSGPFAFLVGVGTFDNLSFRVRQFFLTEPGGEPAMLAALSDTLERCRGIVSFNGRAFDIPQLATRYAMAGQTAPFDLPHIDLLYPARKLYARTLPSCRLAEVERHLLGFERHGDIPGAVIPGMYFHYVRRGSVSALPPIFKHNSLDVLSLVGFLAHLNSDAGSCVSSSAAHHLALGRWDEAMGSIDEAIDQYREALNLDRHGQLGGEVILRLCRLVRRRDGWQACMSLWREELAESRSVVRQVRAARELAKIYEHRLRRSDEALAYCERALASIEAASLHAFFAVTRPALAKRATRLRSKLAEAPPRRPSQKQRHDPVDILPSRQAKHDDH